MTQNEAADVFERIAALLELQGENAFKIRAYRNGAEALRSSEDVMTLAAEGRMPKIAGFGDALKEKIEEMARTGRLLFYERLSSAFSPAIFELFSLPGLGPKKIRVLRDELGVESIAQLKVACEEGKVAGLNGFGAKTAEKLLLAIENQQRYSARHHLDTAGRVVDEILTWIREQPEAIRVEAAGSWRRRRETVGDLDFVVSTKTPAALTERFAAQPFVSEVIAQGPTKASIRVSNGLQCDLRAVADQEFPFALLYFTGSKEHNVAMRGKALKKGFSLNEYGLHPERAGEKAPQIRGEKDLYRWLGVQEIPPELRENQGEWEAAAAGEIPALVETGRLRGTFHNHTRESDGHNTLREMAEAAMDLGLEYLGIADHSKSSVQANGLSEKRLLAQIEEIEQLNREFESEGESFRLLAGSEVDILRDGSLDFSDELLGRLDYVVASVHNAFSIPEAEMTARMIRAAEHPSVTMIGHLTGRLLLKREPYAVDIPAVIEAAAGTGTILELNANPWRLDVDWRWWRKARDAGVLCAINPDAHHTRDLQYLWFGVNTARKGWLRAEDVLNTRKLDAVRTWLAAPKGQRRLR